MANKINELNAQIDAFYTAKENVESIRKELASQSCPIKKGDQIKFKKNKIEQEGIVEDIHSCTQPVEFLGFDKNSELGWVVCGTIILKATGKLGSRQFSVDSFYYKYIDDVWVTEDISDEERRNRLFA
ncbi:hypothetical protein [Yersinia kristensenii]|uniref:hypothetical protein n=1 Tax=Yersinia kristensenii TaxID=28152 RepID=UPI0011A5AD7E|nr:hypothetical protein [Yersinia kristensenii]